MKNTKNEIVKNAVNIAKNNKTIECNQEAIKDIKKRCESKCVHPAVFENMVCEYVGIIKRLIIALCIVSVLLFVSNVIWIVSTQKREVETTIITNDGTSNYVGHNGSINGGD